MKEEIFTVYADLKHPIEDDPRRGDLIAYKGLLFKAAVSRGKHSLSPGPNWELVTVIRKQIPDRIASILELIDIKR